MLLWLFFVLLASFFLFLAVMLLKFYRAFSVNLRVIGGCYLDAKVDTIMQKATVIGELLSYDEKAPKDKRVPYAFEKSMAVASDVFLQNGIDPRQYNLPGLVMMNRFLQGFKVTAEGGDKSGKS